MTTQTKPVFRPVSRLIAGLAAMAGFCGAEIFAAHITGSAALLADGANMSVHCLMLGTALVAALIAIRRPGLALRAEATGGLLAALALVVLGVMAGLHGYDILMHLVTGGPMMPMGPMCGHMPLLETAWGMVIMAIVGMALHGSLALWLKGGCCHLNVRGVYLHMAVYTLVHAAMALAGLAMIAFMWPWLDQALSLLIALVMVYTGSRLGRACTLALIRKAP